MSGFFIVGERKDRPGIYKRRVNIGTLETAGARAGVGCAVVSGDWGPLNVATLVDIAEDLTPYIGSSSGSGYKVIKEMFRGGVQTIVVTRVGSGGTQGSITLKDNAETPVDVVRITAKHPGTFPLAVSVKANLIDPEAKDVTIYNDTMVLENFQITAGTAEVDGIVAALADSKYVVPTKLAAGSGTLKEVSQSALTGGTNPTATTNAYSNGLDASNSERNDVVVVDTNDLDVHAVVSAYIDRIFQSGDYTMAVFSESSSTDLDTRILHARGYDNEKIVYLLNGWLDAAGTTYDGYLAAARIGGMIAACPSNESLTHNTIAGAIALLDVMTNSKIITAIKAGCFVISKSSTGTIMVEKAINTLKTTNGELDAGWKKIRRTKTRFELMYRIETTLEQFVGSVNNDPDGRAALIAAGQSVINAMAGEGKLLAGGEFLLDESNPPAGDSAWFIIRVDDIDSFEIGYLTFQFRFSPEA